MYQELAELLFPNTNTTIEVLKQKYPNRNLKEGAMVTRFAPSPTGFLHMGSLYAAFVSYIFATISGGIFYLRIEDTDQKRQIEDGIQGIIDDLTKFDIIPQEGLHQESYGPYIQSKRRDLYQTFAKYLVSKGFAYPCFLTEAELSTLRAEQEKNKIRPGVYGKFAKNRHLTLTEIKQHLKANTPYVIRFKSNGNFEHKIKFKDMIKGEMLLSENDLDIVLIKSDGLPTYHFAHVVDDYLMHTTHVIRGDEWLSSVPIHIQLYQALELKPPKYAHLAPIMKKDDYRIRKLSKRYDPECSISFYEQHGYPKEAIKLYLATLMNSNFETWWTYDKNIVDFPFTFSKMSVGGPMFDLEKLINISKIWMSKRSAEQIYESTINYVQDKDKDFYQLLCKYKDISIKALAIERYTKKPRKDLSCYEDVKKELWYLYDELYFKNATTYYQKLPIPQYDIGIVKEYFETIYNQEVTEAIWLDEIKQFAQKYHFATSTKEYQEHKESYQGHFGNFCELIRMIVTGQTTSPNLYEVLKLLSKEQIQKRIDYFENFFTE